MRHFILLLHILLITATAHAVTLDDIMALGLPVVTVSTIDHEEPSCLFAAAPAGQDGVAITEAVKVPGRLSIFFDGDCAYDSGDYEEGISGMTIRIRGNTSATGDKHPFKIKLQKKADLLLRSDDNSDKDKDWILLNRASLNDYTGRLLSEAIGMAWTPKGRYVNLWMNDTYRGVYFLTESVKQGKNRVNIDKDSGCLFEYDAYWWNEDKSVSTDFIPLRYRYTFKYPDSDDITDQQMEYIHQLMNATEQSILDGTYDEHIDVESFARWHLLMDLMAIRDAGGTNQYLQKHDDTEASLLQMGPAWDFDSFRMAGTEAWSGKHGWWYAPYLFGSSNRTFTETYIGLWEREKAGILSKVTDALTNFLCTKEGKALALSIPYNSMRWSRETNYVVAESCQDISQWLTARAQWIDRQLREEYQEVFTGIATPLADRHTTPEGEAYNVMGQKVTPTAKGIVIKNGRKIITRPTAARQ